MLWGLFIQFANIILNFHTIQCNLVPLPNPLYKKTMLHQKSKVSHKNLVDNLQKAAIKTQ